MKGYKWLTNRMKSSRGNITWKLNEWQIHKGKIELCQSGFHACKTAFDSLSYIYGDKLFEIEAENIIKSNYKFVSSKMRVVRELPAKEIMLKFAIECAKRVLYNFEERYPNDNRPREAIKVAENILMGTIRSPIDAAADAAIYVAELAAYAPTYATRSTVDRAARSAELAAYAAQNVARSAELAAQNAAKSTADAATRAAAYAADAAAYAATGTLDVVAGLASERKWQSEKLQEIIEEYTLNK